MVGLVLALTAGGTAVAMDARLSRQLWTEAEAFRVIASSDFLFALLVPVADGDKIVEPQIHAASLPNSRFIRDVALRRLRVDW